MRKMLLIVLFALLTFGSVYAATAAVNLRPTQIDISSATSESAVLVTVSGYSSDDARYRLYSGGNQYYCWNASTGTYISSTSYSSGPQVPGTPTTSSTWWIMFQRGSNNSTAASYRDRLGTAYSSNYMTAALPTATSITTPVSITNSNVTFTTWNTYTQKYVILAYDANIDGNLISATSSALDTGAFDLKVETGTTIHRIEVRDYLNNLIESVTGTWPGGTPVASAPVIDPATGDYYYPFNATITCTTENATIYYTLDGTDPDNAEAEYTGPIPINGNTTLKAIAYAPGYDPSPIATATYTFPTITDVSNIAALRLGATDGTVYRLTGEAVLTFQQANRHQKYIQDATAAILIDDAPGIITTAYNLYDGITGVTGTLNLYAGLLQFVPVADPGPATSTGNVIIPEVRTLESLTSADQSKLIKIENALIDSSTGNFASGAQSIDVTQGSTTMTMRTFGSTDYNGTPIPTTPQNITCLVGQFNTAVQISPRFLADFEVAYDYPEGIPVQVGNDIITVTGGNANNSDGEIPPVNNPGFVAMGNYSLELLGAGPWTIAIQTSAPWGACYVEGNWLSVPSVDGVITFNIAPITKGPIVAVILGNQDPTLPVELSSFTAVVTSDMFVNLNWIAESETDHAGYNIYRNETGELASAQRINALIINEGNALGSQISYSYSDYEAYSNMQYYYWLESVSLGGVSQYFGPLQITVGNLEEDPEAPEIQLSTKLLNAFPNPFNPNTNLRYSMKEAGQVTIEIFNTKGQMIRSFANSHTSPGFYQMAWDGRDMNGNLVSSGIYMYRMNSGNYSSTKRMILAK